MASQKFQIGDIVWAKLKGFPLWPGKIIDSIIDPSGSWTNYILFYGSEDYAWVNEKDIQHHNVDLLNSFNRKKPLSLVRGVKALRKHFNLPPKKETVKEKKRTLVRPRSKSLPSREEKSIQNNVSTMENSKENEKNEYGAYPEVKIKQEKMDFEMDADLCIKKEPLSPKSVQKNPKIIVPLKKRKTDLENAKQVLPKTISQEKDVKAHSDIFIKTEPLSPDDQPKDEKLMVPLKKRKANMDKEKDSAEENENIVGEIEDKNSKENEIPLSEKNVKKSNEESVIATSSTEKELKSGIKIKDHKEKKYVDPREVHIGATSSRKAKTAGVKYKTKKAQFTKQTKGSKSNSSKTSAKCEKKVNKKRRTKLSIAELIESLKSEKGNDTEIISEVESYSPDDPSTLKIGFIGLNETGKIIVSKMLEASYDITFWKDDLLYNNCVYLLDLGGKSVNFPEDLIINCDITFCCVADSEESEKIVFQELGILAGFEKNTMLGKPVKGYIEIGNNDPEHSKMIGDAITLKMGRFLEAPIIGTKRDVENGTLIFLAAGHPFLYKKIFYILKMIGKTAIYINSLFGYACKMSLVVKVQEGTICAILAEGLALAKCLQLEDNFMECLQSGLVCSDVIIDKAQKMVSSNFSEDTAINQMQKQMELTLSIGDKAEIPTPVMAAANETFKRALHNHYSDEDISAIFKVT